MAKAASLSAFQFYSAGQADTSAGFCVLFGNDSFLHALAVERLRALLLEDDEGDIRRFEGREAPLRDVVTELATLSMFGSRRVVMVEDADSFVSDNREKLEELLASPPRSGFLILSVRTWTRTTRLAALAEKRGALVVDCNAPKPKELVGQLPGWAKTRYQLALQKAATELLVELLGPNPGVLDQELAKLANVVEQGKPITVRVVQENVSAWQAKAVWDILDAALDGKPDEALEQLDRLINSGESPVGILGMIAPSLRRYATAAHILLNSPGRQPPIPQALERAGVPKFKLRDSAGRLKRLGRNRAGQLWRWVNQADLAMKGGLPSDPRLSLERLICLIGAPQAAQVEIDLL